LTIPVFLRRKRSSQRTKKNNQPVTETKDTDSDYEEWDRIKQERYGTKYAIVLKNEAPRIGSGLRVVYVKEGRKWAYMVSHQGDPNERAGKVIKKLPIKRWQDMKQRHEQYLQRNDPDEVAREISKRRYRKL